MELYLVTADPDDTFTCAGCGQKCRNDAFSSTPVKVNGTDQYVCSACFNRYP